MITFFAIGLINRWANVRDSSDGCSRITTVHRCPTKDDEWVDNVRSSLLPRCIIDTAIFRWVDACPSVDTFSQRSRTNVCGYWRCHNTRWSSQWQIHHIAYASTYSRKLRGIWIAPVPFTIVSMMGWFSIPQYSKRYPISPDNVSNTLVSSSITQICGIKSSKSK